MTTMKLDLPEQLHRQLRELVQAGWAADEQELVREAIRRFLEARRPELQARFIREDVDWGLGGND